MAMITSSLASISSRAMYGRHSLSRKLNLVYVKDNVFFYTSVLLPLIIYVIFFTTFFTNNDSSSLKNPYGLGFFLVKTIWYSSVMLTVSNLAGLLIYGSPLREDDRNLGILKRKGWNRGKKLKIVYVSRGDNHEALGRSLSSTMIILEKFDVNYQIDVVSDIRVAHKLGQKFRCKFHVVPDSYSTERNARYKARALHYLIEKDAKRKEDISYNDVWVLHLDEESIITEQSLAGVHKFINNPANAKKVGQGEIKYNSSGYGDNTLITAIDNVRTGDDLGRFRFQYKTLHKPLFGMHGSYILVPNSIEKEIGFDLGGRGSITEDAYFALHASERGYKFDWVEGYIREQSPFTLNAILRQRRRWYCGLMYLSFDCELKLKTRFFLMLNMILWSIGWLGPLLTIVALFNVGNYSPTYFIVGASLIQGAYASVYLIGAYRGMLDTEINYFRKIYIYVMTFLLMPFSSAVEGTAILYGILRPVKTFDVVKK